MPQLQFGCPSGGVGLRISPVLVIPEPPCPHVAHQGRRCLPISGAAWLSTAGCADRHLRARCHRDSEQGEMRISCLSSAFLFISKCQHSALQVLIGRHLLLTAAELVKERMRMWRGRGLIESGCRDSSSGICSRQVQRNSEGEASRKDSCPSESPVLPNSWDGAGHGDFCTLTRSREGPWG